MMVQKLLLLKSFLLIDTHRMLVTTEGIVLKYLKYGDNKIIAKIYTENFGIKSYIINSLHTKKSTTKSALFQPLTPLTLIVYNKENRQLQHLKEASCSVALKSLHTHILKSTVVVFVAEILLKTIKEEEKNAALFAYLKHFIITLEQSKSDFADYHIVFLLHLTQYLGFFPKTDTYGGDDFFDMREGKFTSLKPIHSTFIDKKAAFYFFQLLHCEYTDVHTLGLNGRMRSVLIEYIITYYRTQLEGMGTINSLDILKVVFS